LIIDLSSDSSAKARLESHMALLRLGTSAAVKEKRLEALRATLQPDEAQLSGLVEDARLLGSLELAGIEATWEQVRASRSGGATTPLAIARLRAASLAVAPSAPLDRAALRCWHAAIIGGVSGWRTTPRERERTEPAPPALIEGRLEILEGWLQSDSVLRLQPAQAGALTLARIVEVLPFEDGNGRVSRLAAAHAIARAGGRAPILVGADGPRLRAALQAAFVLDMAPLAALLEEAAERPLDVMIQALEGRGA
jgi:Fic family protein